MHNTNIRYKEVCNNIININDKIRYAGIINRFGKTIAGKMRNGLKPLFKQEEARDEFFLTAVRESMRSSFTNSIGRNHFTLTVHDKVKLVSFMHGEHVIYISIDSTASYDEIVAIVNKVKEMQF
jgi:hypothetical protein